MNSLRQIFFFYFCTLVLFYRKVNAMLRRKEKKGKADTKLCDFDRQFTVIFEGLILKVELVRDSQCNLRR